MPPSEKGDWVYPPLPKSGHYTTVANDKMSGPIIKHNKIGETFEVKMWAYLRGRGEFFGFKRLTGCGPNSWEGYFMAHGDPRDDEFCSCNISEEFKHGGISPKLLVIKPDELHKLMMPVGFTRISEHPPV